MSLRFAERTPEAYDYPLTIRHLLANALTAFADQEIIYRDQSRYTYRQLVQRIGRLASLLAGLGVEQGATVAVMDWDSPRYLEAYFAVPMMGAVLQTVNVRLPPPQIAYTLAHAKAEVLIVHRDFFPLVDALRPSLPGIRNIVAISEAGEQALPEWAAGEYEQLSAAASPDFRFEDFDENALATTFYTSGTTGQPKNVSFTHRQLVLHTLATCAPFGEAGTARGIGFGDVYMPLTPMFHVHAWGVPYLATMLGLKQVYPGRYEPDMICRLRSEHKVTYSHCVPTVLQMVLDTASRTGADLSGWKITIGGSALTKALCAEGRRLGMEVFAGYGMSETAPTLSIARPRHLDESGEPLIASLSSAGVAIPLVYARIVDADMADLPHDGATRGELVIRAPWLTQAYGGDAEASAALWQGGWLHTQDVAAIDPDGFIHIRDRLKDVIKTGGEWIDSIQLEELVATASGVGEAAIVAVPDRQWGERPLAVIVPQLDATVTLESINAPVEQAIARGEITAYARLEHFVLTEALPRTSVGKIDKKLLRETYARSDDGRPQSDSQIP